MKTVYQHTMNGLLTERLKKIEEHLCSDVIFFYGDIHDGIERVFRDFIEDLKNDQDEQTNRDTLSIILNTNGGSVETVERMVRTTRQHYNKVDFIIPDSAYSAGTIFCMSGDEIYMDYSSALGPIDPQVNNGQRWVPALGYIDKVKQILNNPNPTYSEIEWLRVQDMAFIQACEQAKNLTVSLLKDWLVKYKFKNWNTRHSSGESVTMEYKQQRAEQIATQLGNNTYWLSHSRPIGIRQLQDLKLIISDYTDDLKFSELIRNYNDLMCQSIGDVRNFLHSRKNI